MNQGKPWFDKVSWPAVCFVGAIAFSGFYITSGRHCELVPRILFKIVPILIILCGLLMSLHHTDDKKTLILPVVALLFSVLGDIVGEMKGTGLGFMAFALQILFFALAQIVYCVSFLRFFNLKGRANRMLYDVLVMLVLAFFAFFAIVVLPHVEPKLLPLVIGYLVVIFAMALSAMMQERNWHGCFAAGAILFVLSDSAIAYGLYVGSFPHRGALVMSTYYAAQLLLNFSLFKSHN